VTFITFQDAQTLDPVGWTGATSAVGFDSPMAYAIFDDLMLEDLATGEVKPHLAEALTSTDFTAWTLKLRPGVKFSDGTALDTTAVKTNWDRIAAAKGPHQANALAIASSQVVDPLTLTLTLKAPDINFPRIVAQHLGFIASPTALQASGTSFGDKPVGAGPFVLVDHVRDSKLVYKRNSAYWDSPKPYLESLTILIIADPGQRYSTLKTGGANLLFTGTAWEYGARAKSDGFTVKQVNNLLAGSYLLFNTKKPPFNDLTARQAVAFALDRDKEHQTLYGGAVQPAKTLFLEGSPFYDPSFVLPSYDKQKAQKLFDDYAAKNGGPLEFTVTTTQNSKPAIEFYQAQLGEFRNVKMNLDVTTSANIPSVLGSGGFSAGVFAVGGFDPAPNLDLRLRSGATLNFGRYANSDVDTALQLGGSSPDQSQRKNAYQTVQRHIIDDVPITFFTPLTGFFISAPGIHIPAYLAGSPRWEEVWITK
jgi:peptide/nickel transport system substrate-binding protein